MRIKYLFEIIAFPLLFFYLFQFIHLYDHTYGDESILLNGAYRILQGDVIYKDFAEYIVPLPFYTLAGLFKIFGAKLLVARIFNVLCMGIISIIIYLILKRITKNTINSISTTITYSILGYSFWYITSHHWMLLAVELIVIYLLLIFLENKKYLYIILSGLLTSLTPFIIQHKGGLFALSVTVWIFILYYFYIRDKYLVISYIISLLIFPIIFTTYFVFVAIGNLDSILDNTVGLARLHFTSRYTRLPHYFYTGNNAIFLFLRNISTADVVDSLHMIFKVIYYILLGYLPFICLPLFFVKTFLEWRGPVRDDQFYRKLIFLLTGIFTFIGIFVGRSDQYQLITILPFQIFTVFFVLQDIKKIKPIVSLFIFLLTTGVLVYGVENVIEINKKYIYPATAPNGDTVYYKDLTLAEDLQNFYNYSRTNIKEDKLVAIYWGDKFYFYLQKRNPVYYNLITPLHLNVEELQKIIFKIEETKPQHIIWDRYGTREWDYAACPFCRPLAEKFVKNSLIDYIKEHYNMVAFFPVANIVVYKRK